MGVLEVDVRGSRAARKKKWGGEVGKEEDAEGT